MKSKLFLMFETVIITAAAIVITVFAADPGSTEDPVVSKSYVDNKIAELLQTLENTGASNAASNTGTNAGANTDTEKLKYVPVHVGVGQKLLGDEGTEIILRVGRSFAVVPGKESIIDVTSGTELVDKAELKKNHVLIVPRNDGRGVRVVEDAWFLVKGNYTIS